MLRHFCWAALVYPPRIALLALSTPERVYCKMTSGLNLRALLSSDGRILIPTATALLQQAFETVQSCMPIGRWQMRQQHTDASGMVCNPYFRFGSENSEMSGLRLDSVCTACVSCTQ
ncbi:hypothetical protein C8Q76DRAFT_200893 [Earliella scabrosa]|nr:hypothetical protein C8Q76DRAFT_200893 [Earliella scabrosa]